LENVSPGHQASFLKPKYGNRSTREENTLTAAKAIARSAKTWATHILDSGPICLFLMAVKFSRALKSNPFFLFIRLIISI